jgi:trigger factor
VKITVERMPQSQVRLEITAEADEHDAAVDRAYRKVSREIMVPGFRKGKAPRSIIERMYGRELFVEEANRGLMEDLYRKAIEQEDLAPVGDPEVEIVEFDPLAFAVTVPVYPTIDPGPYQDVRIDPVDAAITDDDIDEVLTALQREQSPWVDPSEERSPKDGDQVTLDLLVLEGEEEFQPINEDAIFVLGEANLLQELHDTIVSLKIGETGDAVITFTEEDDRIPENDDRRGKTLTYRVMLKEIKERDLLPLDDEFAKTYGSADSLEALKDRIRQNLHSERTKTARTEALNLVLERITEGASIEIPEAMIDDAVEERVNQLRTRLQYGGGGSLEAVLRQSGQSEEQLRQDLRPASERDLRTSLILREIAKREEIEITGSEVDAEIDEITADVPEREQARELYRTNDYLRSALRNDLFDRRLTDRLFEIATEGKGAVINAFVPPEADASDAGDEDSGAATAVAEPAPAEEASAEATDAAENDDLPAGAVAGDGSNDCPSGYPIKGNASSLIYHVENDSTYAATIPEVCFATEDVATAAGYRPTKRHEGERKSQET